MSYQFTETPVQGQVDILPNGRKMQYNNGRWEIFTNTLATNVPPSVMTLPPIVSGSAPALPNINPLWFDTNESTLNVQMLIGGDYTWQPCTPAAPAALPIEPIYSSTAPGLPSANGFWFQSNTGILYIQKNLEGTYSWERCSPSELASAMAYSDDKVSTLASQQVSNDAATLNAAKTYTDARESSIRIDTATADASMLSSAKTYADAQDTAQGLVISAGLVAAGTAATTYTDTREIAVRSDLAAADTTTLNAAKTYADTQNATQATAITNGDAAALASAKTYTDARETSVRTDFATADTTTLNAAKTYTDTKDTARGTTTTAAITTAIAAIPPAAVAPLESESAPVLPNANPFWFKPSTSVLHYQYNDGNSTQWIEI